ncbi:protein of unknown function [Paenibacillus alvei]|uniref:Uncharacterized protein n=1 Tax=Paenibacillus alvei TaxID=44250 RepID=A0A383RAV6_PAEAL|nr:protein of unknown function [Paenibacillus alvei]
MGCMITDASASGTAAGRNGDHRENGCQDDQKLLHWALPLNYSMVFTTLAVLHQYNEPIYEKLDGLV